VKSEFASIDDVRSLILDRPMRPIQVMAVATAVAINMMDGFDILAMSFVAGPIGREWGLNPERLGLLLSAGLIGMTIGAFFLSSLSDLFGRRAAAIICLGLMSVGMLLASAAPSLEVMMIWRVVTGMGVGAMNAATGSLTYEYASRRRRELSIGLVVVGYPFGAVVGGFVSVWLLQAFGWRSIFVFGGLVSAALIPLALWRMPESLEFLISRQPRNALSRVNAVLAKMDAGQLRALPAPANKADATVTYRPLDLFQGQMLWRTLPVCLTYFMFMTSQYFILNWTPKLMTEAGFSDAGGISFSIITNIGGVLGGGLIGLFTARFGLRRVAVGVLCLMAASIIAFGTLPIALALLATASLVTGFGVFGSAVCIFSVMASNFPPNLRATGIGFAISAGRLGSIFGAYLGGLLLSLGFSRALLCIVLAMPALVAAALVGWVASRGEHRGPVQSPA
jgi:benzoate transport